MVLVGIKVVDTPLVRDAIELARNSSEPSDMALEDTKPILVGEWVSLTPEVRPSATRNPGGTLKAFYLSREFKYLRPRPVPAQHQ